MSDVEAGVDGCRGPGGDTFGEAVGEFEAAAAGADDLLVGHGVGTKAARSSSQRSLPWRWLCRWTTGFQPPETASRSQAILRRPGELAVVVDAADGHGRTAGRSPGPSAAVFATALPMSTRMPASAAAAATAVARGGRRRRPRP